MNSQQEFVSITDGFKGGGQLREFKRHRDPKIEWISLAELSAGCETMDGMVARSRQLRAVFASVERLRPYRSPILVTGETGTGKELVARALHKHGPYAKGQFVVFNCCNFVEALAESQLFGHVKGAFTDASQESQGCFRAANCGTLLLDEIGDLPLGLQGKLLRAVETCEIQPVGSAQNIRVDLRLVAATNRDLATMVRARQFRADLYYRLSATTVFLTPLRERSADLEVLLAHFIQRYNQVLGKRVQYVSADALVALRRRSWPGNARELAHATENAILATPDDRIGLEDLPTAAIEIMDSVSDSGAGSTGPIAETIRGVGDESVEPEATTLKSIIRNALLDALQKSGGNRRRAAQILGVSRSTFYRMLASHGISLEPSGTMPSLHSVKRIEEPKIRVAEAPRPWPPTAQALSYDHVR
jgi:two-component system response regulator HydG